MAQIYDKHITDHKQPLIIVKHGENMIHLPPEFCRIDGVPESIRASPAMRDCLAICRVNPDQKMRDINSLIGILMNQQVFRDWNLSIESNPIDLKNQTVLQEP